MLNQVRAAPDVAERVDEGVRGVLVVVDGSEKDAVGSTKVALDPEDVFTVAVNHYQALDEFSFCPVADRPVSQARQGKEHKPQSEKRTSFPDRAGPVVKLHIEHSKPQSSPAQPLNEAAYRQGDYELSVRVDPMESRPLVGCPAEILEFSVRVHFRDEPIFQWDVLFLLIGPSTRIPAQFPSCNGCSISKFSIIHEDLEIEAREEYLGHCVRNVGGNG